MWYSDTLSEEVSTTGVTQGNLELSCLLILLIHTKDKDNKMKILDWLHVLISYKENRRL